MAPTKVTVPCGELYLEQLDCLRVAIGDGEVSLSVLRGGELLQITMGRIPAEADWLQLLGGMLTPASRP